MTHVTVTAAEDVVKYVGSTTMIDPPTGIGLVVTTVNRYLLPVVTVDKDALAKTPPAVVVRVTDA